MRLIDLGAGSLKEIGPRILADILFLSGSLFLACSTYLIAWIMILKMWPDSEELRNLLAALYVQNVILLVLLGILVFMLSGFYTHARAYSSRYKLVTIFNAVSLTFLVHAFLQYFIFRLPSLPRGVDLLAWFFSLVTIGGSRTFKHYVTQTYSIERKPGPGEREVRRVLVVGGAGYIGSVLVRRLLEAGYHVRILDALLFGEDSIKALLHDPKFELQQADFRHVEAVVKAVRNVDAVIHLGAIVGDPACNLDRRMTLETNLASAAMIKAVCRGAGIQRFLFASTCSVYGASEYLLDERSELNPVSLYACTKIDAERVILGNRVGGFYPTVLRLGTAFGSSYRPRFDLVVNLLSARAVVEKKIAIFNKTQWRPFIHVEEIARVFITCLKAPLSLVGYEIFNVGSYSLNSTLDNLAVLIKKQIPDVQIEYVERIVDKRNYRVSFDKIHTMLGFTCIKSLEDGIREIKTAIESGAVTDYCNPIYYNDRSLEQLNLRSLQEEVGGIQAESDKFLNGSVPAIAS